MIFFQLGREYKLSVAELMCLFPDLQIEFVSRSILITSGVRKEQVMGVTQKIGGVIKIGEICKKSISELASETEGKFQYGLSLFGAKDDLKKILIAQKKELKSAGISSRFVNKNFLNLSSAQIIGERLLKRGTDFSLVKMHGSTQLFQTFWVQDIDAYSQRDYGKSRDMQVGMLPPKLCQMMINFSGGEKVYDPFVGLGSVLIESVYMGYTEVYGSDLSEAMVETSARNLQDLKGIKKFEYRIEKLNAKFISEAQYLSKSDVIVTEGYLGEVMTQKNISLERIEKQKQSLEKIYSGFFGSLRKANFKGNIIVCFPFWEINKKYIYADNLYKIVDDFCNTEEIIPIDRVPETFKDLLSHSKSGSLLYKRNSQLVGREIHKLTMK